MQTMQQQLCLLIILICYCVISTSINIVSNEPARSVPQETPISFTSEIIGTQPFTASFNVRSESSKTNLYWNGGTILTHESNLESMKGRSETTIASTRCGNLIFIAFNSAQVFCFDNDPNNADCPGVPDGFYNGAHYTVSLNGGKTWKYMYGPPPLDTDIYTHGDPWLSMGGKSSKYNEELLYFSNIARNATTLEFIGISVHIAKIIYKDNNPRKNAIYFEWIRASLIREIENDDFLDKGAIAADPYNANKAYVSYKLFGAPPNNKRNIELYATHNAGISWKGPVVLKPAHNNDDIFEWFSYSYVAVGAYNDVYVIWSDFIWNNDVLRNLKYMFIKSSDGGITFPNAPIPINPDFTNFNPHFQLPIAHNREIMHSQPTMDVFTTIHDYRHNYLNRIIAAYAYSLTDYWTGHTGFIDDMSSSLNSVNIGISYSDDAGETWNYIDPFKEQIPDRFVKRMFPTVSVSSNGKSVNIAYLEIKEVKRTDLPICKPDWDGFQWRTSFYHDMVDTYYIHSDNGGITWSDPIKLNKESVDWCTNTVQISPNYGDYMLAISDSKGGVHLAGVTNGFTDVPGFDPPLTTVDVIYYHSKPKKKKCNNGRRWSKTYNAWINEENKEEYELFENLEEENKNIDIDLPWTVIVIGVIGITICVGTPYLIWMMLNTKR